MALRVWIWLLSLSVLWGGSFFFAKVAIGELGPLTVVFARVALAGGIQPRIILGPRRSVPQIDEQRLPLQNTSHFARDSENPRRSALKHVTPASSDLQVMPLRCQTSP